jgi:large subunit ribosomal protein L4
MKQIHPRDYSYSLPRKALQLATRMALASKVRDDEIVLIDKLEFGAPKTKEMAGILKTLGCEGHSVLVATAGYDVNVYKSARNIDRVCVSPAKDLNAYSVLTAKRVLMTTAAMDALKSAAALVTKNGEAK